jgi:hypothetical protein
MTSAERGPTHSPPSGPDGPGIALGPTAPGEGLRRLLELGDVDELEDVQPVLELVTAADDDRARA